MRRITIIGCPGSGKTTLALKLGEVLGLPVVHLDQLGWTGNWEFVDRAIFDEKLTQALVQPEWIIDGNYGRTMLTRLEQCDTVIYLDFHRITSLVGVVKRVISNHGKSRPDMGGNCPERFDPEFLKVVWNFNRDNREKIYGKIAKANPERVIILKNRREVRMFLNGLR